MRTVLIFLATFIVAFLALIVWSSAMSPDCEALYNEYTSTVDLDMREHLFQDGLSNGCFHYN